MIIKKDNKSHIIPNPKDVMGYKCYICGKTAIAQHHLIYGRGKRQISDREKLTIAICEYCHRVIHHYHKHDKELKAMAQKVWLDSKGGDNKENRDKWYKLFYRFYFTVEKILFSIVIYSCH